MPPWPPRSWRPLKEAPSPVATSSAPSGASTRNPAEPSPGRPPGSPPCEEPPMPPPTPPTAPFTLLQLAQYESTLSDFARGQAQTDLDAAQAQLTLDLGKLDDELKKLKQLGDKIAANRAALAVITLPAEAAELLKKLT